jgi:hypothetical protein
MSQGTVLWPQARISEKDGQEARTFGWGLEVVVRGRALTGGEWLETKGHTRNGKWSSHTPLLDERFLMQLNLE